MHEVWSSQCNKQEDGHEKTDPCGILANLVYGEESDGLTII